MAVFTPGIKGMIHFRIRNSSDSFGPAVPGAFEIAVPDDGGLSSPSDASPTFGAFLWRAPPPRGAQGWQKCAKRVSEVYRGSRLFGTLTPGPVRVGLPWTLPEGPDTHPFPQTASFVGVLS